MKKSTFNVKYITKVLNIIAMLFVIAFVIGLGFDFYKYNTTLNSAPFYVFILVRIITCLIPSLLILLASKVVKKRIDK